MATFESLDADVIPLILDAAGPEVWFQLAQTCRANRKLYLRNELWKPIAQKFWHPEKDHSMYRRRGVQLSLVLYGGASTPKLPCFYCQHPHKCFRLLMNHVEEAHPDKPDMYFRIIATYIRHKCGPAAPYSDSTNPSPVVTWIKNGRNENVRLALALGYDAFSTVSSYSGFAYDTGSTYSGLTHASLLHVACDARNYELAKVLIEQYKLPALKGVCVFQSENGSCNFGDGEDITDTCTISNLNTVYTTLRALGTEQRRTASTDTDPLAFLRYLIDRCGVEAVIAQVRDVPHVYTDSMGSRNRGGKTAASGVIPFKVLETFQYSKELTQAFRMAQTAMDKQPDLAYDGPAPPLMAQFRPAGAVIPPSAATAVSRGRNVAVAQLVNLDDDLMTGSDEAPRPSKYDVLDDDFFSQPTAASTPQDQQVLPDVKQVATKTAAPVTRTAAAAGPVIDVQKKFAGLEDPFA
eukprot:TRINITY_DN14122_c0_g1_i1.p1 TRINITY_DN14122_c0_g1~~TRINITY_DN14122_c0_g1_i1.p1  ORF type:complete len:464 (-),score=85.51 TRINITY_DN14122_c0_g1_i1:69-1460(-)